MFTNHLIPVALQISLLAAPLAQTPPPEQGSSRSGRSAAESQTGTPAARNDAARSIRAFRLKQIDASEARDHLRELIHDVFMSVVPHTNTLLCRCDDQQAALIAGAIELIDVAGPSQPKTSLHVFPIRHRSATEMLEHLTPVTDRGAAEVYADESRSSLVVVSQSDEDVKSVETLLRSLDTPMPTVRLEFAVFLADLNATDPAAPIPDDLQPVAKELSRFGRVTLLGRCGTASTQGQDFRVRGLIQNALESDIRGTILRADAGSPVQIRVDARLFTWGQPGAATGEKASRNSSFEVSTKLALPPGEFVAIGVAAAGAAEGQSLILVLRAQM